MAATPLDQECLPVTLGKMPTWKTMVVPVRSISTGQNSFFEAWLAEQGTDPVINQDGAPEGPDDAAKQDELRDTIKQLIAARPRAAPNASIDELPHVAEEVTKAKSFDLVLASKPKHGPDVRPLHAAPSEPGRPKKPMSEAERLANAERQRRYRERRRADQPVIPESKSETPAPSPAIEPEAQRELSGVEKATRTADECLDACGAADRCRYIGRRGSPERAAPRGVCGPL